MKKDENTWTENQKKDIKWREYYMTFDAHNICDIFKWNFGFGTFI